MPGYRTHDTIGLIAAGGGSAFAFHVTKDIPTTGLFFLAVVFGTLFFSPDLDLKSKISSRWGPLQFIWYPYRKLVPHRSWLSHSGVSAAIRVIYLAIIFYFLGWLVGIEGVEWSGVWQHKGQLGIVLAGLIFADLVHVVTDWIK
jgi:uncharacterized metal-binding protein